MLAAVCCCIRCFQQQHLLPLGGRQLSLYCNRSHLLLSLLLQQGLTFVLNERFMADDDEPITGLNLVFMLG